ncbi:hypothetical protein GKR60_16880 [Providencia stuartii]|uniref:hypothetical protein n=1 Tax=Providencia stuartii TaxID=588 RepID=UPI0012B54708|nr:hypothetical protein [Providencia stuartii]MDT2044267.1 hypothetical protein [Providencia stuartii]MTC13399.1 hypothetical protein [Providencia stuartii]
MQISFELLSFVLSIVSLLVSAGAVWLSFKFYQMSDNASKDAQKSSDQIQKNTEKLEELFSKLYADTFSIMKDTVGDMRQHIYHSPEKEQTYEEQLNEMKANIITEIKSTLDENIGELSKNELKIKGLEEKLEGVINKQINITVEKNNDSLSNQIMDLVEKYNEITINQIIDLLSRENKFSTFTIVNTISAMKRENLITTIPDNFSPSTKVMKKL